MITVWVAATYSERDGLRTYVSLHERQLMDQLWTYAMERDPSFPSESRALAGYRVYWGADLLKAMGSAEIHAVWGSAELDPDEMPELGEDWFKKARLVRPGERLIEQKKEDKE